MHRRIPCFALLWLFWAHTAQSANGSATALPVGSMVLAKRPGVHFRIKNEDAGEMHAGLIERVQKVQGEWLWLGRGWVQQRDVLPIWEAVEHFTAQIEQRPTAFAYVARAAATGKRGAFPEEMDGDIAKALTLDTDFAPAYWLQGASFARKGDFERAIDAYDDAIRLDPQYAQAYHDRGHAWWSTGKHDKALKDLDKALRVCPRLASAHATRSLILHSKGDHEQAFVEAQEALKHNPANAMAHVDIGWYWSENGDVEQAIAAYTEAIRVDRTCGQARLQRGRLYSRNGDYQNAVVDLNQAVQLMPKNVEALDARGFVYYRLGAIDKSHADRIAAARLRRTSTVTQQKVGQPLDEFAPSFAKNFAAGENAATNHVQQPTAAETQQAGTSAANPSASQPLSEEAQQRARLLSRAIPLNNAAWRCATSSDERYLNGARAVELATEACELTEWKRAGFIDTLAAAYAEAGDFETAVKWQTKAIELLATNPTVKAEAEERLELYQANKPYRADHPGRLARDPNAGGDVQ